MKSTLLNMTAVLFGITLVASAGVGVVHLITAEPIAEAKRAATLAALNEVLPEFEGTPAIRTDSIDKLPVAVYTASRGGEVVGYAVETMTKEGFGGIVRLMVGFTPEGEVYNINVLEQSETPGLGTKMTDEDNVLLRSIQGRNPASGQLVDGKLAVAKDGGDVDALTAATISSRAYVDAVNRAWAAYRSAAQDSESAAAEVASDPDSDAASDAAAASAAERTNEPEAQKGGQNE